VLAKRQLTDLIAVAIAIIAMLILLRFKKVQEPFVILAAAIVGLLFKNYL
jgi:chromate transporter